MNKIRLSSILMKKSNCSFCFCLKKPQRISVFVRVLLFIGEIFGYYGYFQCSMVFWFLNAQMELTKLGHWVEVFIEIICFGEGEQ